MIRKFRFGNPYETEAVVHNIELTVGEFPYFYLKEESTPILYYRMENEDRVYGLGENVRGINKRGWLYESYCKDDSNHSESKHSLYGAHNFFVVDGDKTFGIFVDCPSKVSFDIGYSKIDEFKIQIDCWNFDWYVIDGETVLEIIKEFRQLIGRSYIPPKWAFGYQQSRWGYASCEDIEDVVEGHRKNQIPLDAVYLDIDYMDSYKNFTVDEERFPDFTQFVSDMKKKGIHLVPIIDAGVKVAGQFWSPL